MFPGDKGGGDNIGAIIMGYKQPGILSRIFAQRLYRPRYYRYFDSWENDPLPELPQQYKPYQDPAHREPLIRPYLHKSCILLRSCKRYRRAARLLPPSRFSSGAKTSRRIFLLVFALWDRYLKLYVYSPIVWFCILLPPLK